MNLKSYVETSYVWDEDTQKFISVPTETYYIDGQEVNRDAYMEKITEWEDMLLLADPIEDSEQSKAN